MMRALQHSIDFFFERIGLVVLFSIPFFFALLIPTFVSTPSYLALGGVFLRTGSIPEVGAFEAAVAAFAYLVSLFIISDSIANINVLIKSKRTLTKATKRVWKALGTHAVNIFLIYTIATILVLIFQLVTFDLPLRGIILPLLMLFLSFALFFVPPAIVIDERQPWHAVVISFRMAIKKLDAVLSWMVLGLVMLTVGEFILLFLPYPLGQYATLLFNSVVVIPFLLIYQTHIYMKKYGLAY